MKSSLLPLLWTCAVLACCGQPAHAQIQGGAPTLGAPGPPQGAAPKQENASQHKIKLGACNQYATDHGLTGQARINYIRDCTAQPYTIPFTPLELRPGTTPK